MLKIQVIIGSTRPNRFSEKPAAWIMDLLKKYKDIDAELIDLRDHQLPMFDEGIPPSQSKGNYQTPGAKEWAQKIAQADGYIIVTPEYNHGYPAVLKNALDYPYYEWNKKPIAFISYGSMGGARVIEQLRLVAVELQMAPIRGAVHIPHFWELIDEKGNFDASSLTHHAEIMIDQLIWWGKALKTARINAAKG